MAASDPGKVVCLLDRKQGMGENSKSFKVCFFGRTAAGKSSTLATVTLREPTAHHTETLGMQVSHVAWQYQKPDGNLLTINYQFWDVGANGLRKYDYFSDAYKANVDCALFVFNPTDRNAYEDLSNQISSVKLPDRVVKAIVATRKDLLYISQVTEQEFSQLGETMKMPIYRVANLNASTESEAKHFLDSLTALLMRSDAQPS